MEGRKSRGEPRSTGAAAKAIAMTALLLLASCGTKTVVARRLTQDPIPERSDMENFFKDVLSESDVSSQAILTITGEGEGEVFSSAMSSSETFLENAVASAVADAIADVMGGGDAQAAAEAAAEAIGVATARAMATAFVMIDVEGSATGSAEASASVEVIATVVATAIAEAFAAATGDNEEVSSRVRTEVTMEAVVEAIAEARVSASSTGGQAESFSQTVSRAVAEVIASAIAFALAELGSGTASVDVGAMSTTDIVMEITEVGTENNASVSGNASADTSGSGIATVDEPTPATGSPSESDVVDPENTEEAEEIEDNEDTEEADNDEDTEDAEDDEDIEEAEDDEDNEDAEDTEEAEDAEGDEDTEDFVNSPNILPGSETSTRNQTASECDGSVCGDNEEGQQTCSQDVTWGFDYYGNDLPRDKFKNGPDNLQATVEGCCAACMKTPECVAFTWNEEYGHCWMKFSADNLIPSSISASKVVRAVGEYKGPCEEGLQPTVLLRGANLPVNRYPNGPFNKQQNAEMCCASCMAVPECTAFTYIKDSRDCWLKGTGTVQVEYHTQAISKIVRS